MPLYEVHFTESIMGKRKGVAMVEASTESDAKSLYWKDDDAFIIGEEIEVIDTDFYDVINLND